MKSTGLTYAPGRDRHGRAEGMLVDSRRRPPSTFRLRCTPLFAVSVVAVGGLLAGTAGGSPAPVPVPRARLGRRAEAAAPTVQLAPGDVTAPAAAAMLSPTTAQSVIPSTHLPLAWKATDTASGIGSYDVRARSAAWNGAFGAFSTWKSATPTTTGSYPAAAGRTYCFSVRARDKSANVSSWSTDRCTSIPLDDVSLTSHLFTRSARIAGAFAGTLSTTSQHGASLTRTGVVARSIALVARTCPTCGVVSVKWNGQGLKRISLAGPAATRSFAIASFARPTRGTLQVVVTSSKRRIWIDAVAVENPTLSGSITLKGGSTYANSTGVTIGASVWGSSGAVQMRLANGSAAGGAWVPFTPGKPFTLAAGDGLKSVAAQFRDPGGNVSTVALDTITLDTTAPAVAVVPGSTEVANGTDVPIHATVTDGSPLRSVTLETIPTGGGPATNTAMTLASGTFGSTVAGPTTSFGYTVTAIDAAGNGTTMPATAPDGPYQVTVDPLPTSQNLIAQALADGTIDYPTSLEYRTWALFDDPQLPDAYFGTGSSGEDEMLAVEVRDSMATLPPDAQAVIAPYFARPDSASSPFGPEPAPSALHSVHASDLEGPLDARCQTSWESDPGAHFKVSSCGIDDITRQNVLAAAEAVYGPETGDMGTEVSDGPSADNGGDGLIDIYILDTLSCRMRGDVCVKVPGGDLAVTPPTLPCSSSPSQCAAYITISTSAAKAASMAGTIAHEFFHVLQWARNGDAMFWKDGGGNFHEHWFTEASAEWAAWH